MESTQQPTTSRETAMLAVTFTNTDGNETVSRFFQTIRAARKWAKWLASQHYAANVRIMRGGSGGEPVQ
jgi:hypothetical protein